jgi:hypothetical protein
MDRGPTKRLEEPLTGLLEAVRNGDDPLCVRFPEPLPSYGERLLRTLGVRIVIDPTAPRLSDVRSSGRPAKTRRQLTDDERGRMRESYYARPDKAIYRDRRVSANATKT